MTSAKDLNIIPIEGHVARAFVKRWHYSHTTAPNSQVHLGAVLDGRLVGAMQFGPPMDKRKVIHLVEGTAWNDICLLYTSPSPRDS